jgi:DNA polymerase-3 subunit alpha
MNYYSLHNHDYASNVRFLDSINKPELMIKKAIALGYKGMAFTNHECLSDEVELLHIRDSLKETNPDFKIIFGNEIYLIDPAKVKADPEQKYYHFILIAKDAIGYDQLKALSSRAWDRAYFERGMQRVPTTYKDIEEIVMPNQGHILASTACVGGQLPQAIIHKNKEDLKKFVLWGITTFGKENFNIEVQPSDLPDQVAVNATLVRLAKAMGLNFISTTDSHYLDKEDLSIQEAFLKSRDSSDREVAAFYKYTYVQSFDEMRDLLVKSGLTEEDAITAIENTNKIGESVVDFDPRHSTIVPSRPIDEFKIDNVFEKFYDKYPMLGKFAHSDNDQDRYLFHLIEAGAIEKKLVNDQVADRLNTELGVIETVSKGLQQNVSSYFILMRNVIDLAWKDSFVGCGRGSSGGFLINYLIDLIQINPLQYGLPYWRFLNNSRLELPDIDSDCNPVKKNEIMDSLRGYYGTDNVLNCITFKTESLKAAVLTAARGLGINNDEAQDLSLGVPMNRGHVYTLSECLNGNPDLDLDPVPGFEEKLRAYPNLYETVEKIEGLATNASVHASAVYIFNNGYLEHNSLMRAPSGVRVTAFDMDATNELSGLKIDLLFTDAENKLMKCLDLLLRAKQIEWQGSLRATYNKYLHPDVLDYQNPDMWKRATDGKIMNLFQYETQVGAVGIKKAEPHSVMELATINSAIRVQSEGSVQPIDRYAAYKADISLWYREMSAAGLSVTEQLVMKKHLAYQYGCSLQQEDFMQLSMDPQIAGYTIGEANTLRKTIAHKILDQIAKQKDLFFDHCKQQGTSDKMANYVWDYDIEPLCRYSFSVIHALAYSVVALQEMNLATRYSPLYWDCACLCVNSGNSDTGMSDDDSDDDSVDDPVNDKSSDGNDSVNVAVDASASSDDKKSAKRVAPNYGKIAKAISDIQQRGVNVMLPDINSSGFDFLPDASKNAIEYPLGAISGIGEELVNDIIKSRPYASLSDFCSKVALTDGDLITLVKAGCFDALEGKPREDILRECCVASAARGCALPATLTAVHLKKAISYPSLRDSLIPFADGIKVFNFQSYAVAHFEKAADKKKYAIPSGHCSDFFQTAILPGLNAAKNEYENGPDGKLWVKISALERIKKTAVAPVMDWLNSERGRDAFSKAMIAEAANAQMAEVMQGTPSDWEMETLVYYHSGHPLAKVDRAEYGIRPFDTLPEEPTQHQVTTRDGRQYMAYDNIATIVGTVVNADRNKHIVSLLTPDGVVNVKFFKNNYATYAQKLSYNDPANPKRKITIEDSWFKRGTKLLINGYRRENMFFAKGSFDREKPWRRMPVSLIEGIGEMSGMLTLRDCRKGRDDV